MKLFIRPSNSFAAFILPSLCVLGSIPENTAQQQHSRCLDKDKKIARVPPFDVSAVLQGLVKAHIDHLLSRS